MLNNKTIAPYTNATQNALFTVLSKCEECCLGINSILSEKI